MSAPTGTAPLGARGERQRPADGGPLEPVGPHFLDDRAPSADVSRGSIELASARRRVNRFARAVAGVLVVAGAIGCVDLSGTTSCESVSCDAGRTTGLADAALPDAGESDGGGSDAGPSDAGASDAGALDAGGSDGGRDARPSSCLDLLRRSPDAPSGYYAIDVDGVGSLAPFEVWCNMTDFDGGWTLAANISRSAKTHMSDAGPWDVSGNGRVDLEYLGEKLADGVITSLWTDRIWVSIDGGSGDIHCERARQAADFATFSVTRSPRCGYTFANTTTGVASTSYDGPAVWRSYDYRAYSNPYGCGGASATDVPSGAGGCAQHPSRDGYLWVR